MIEPLAQPGPVEATVDLRALAGNLATIRGMLTPDIKIMAIVKANGYGHGAVAVANAALAAGAQYLGVACPAEGAELRRAGVSAPILVLGTLPPEQAEAVVELDLEQAVYAPDQVRRLQRAAAYAGRPAKAHIKADTGMGRIGVRSQAELDVLLAAFGACPNVQVTGLFTHFADADGEEEGYTRRQAEAFARVVARVRGAGYAPMVHAANSAALYRFPELSFDCVRAGIAMYGYGLHDRPEYGLQPVMSWQTRVANVKTVPAGAKLSYGCTYEAETERRIATLPVGYADGYRRAFSNRGMVLIRGQRAPVAGRVCMDQIMVDVTAIPGVSVGDEAVLMGRQGNDALYAGELASWADTISYEILTCIGNRVERVYVR